MSTYSKSREGDMAHTFDPNQTTFEQGLQRIRRAVENAGLDQTRGIVTSRDDNAREAQRLLETDNVPEGWVKWQLPVYLERPSQLYIALAQPGAEAPEHSHDEGDLIRFVVSGSVIYNGIELTAGDWMFVPAGAKYSVKAGEFGALDCCCYCCSCVGGR
jgi:mannose-6-phosphate isomerase-like protein (cupin superfamily)